MRDVKVGGSRRKRALLVLALLLSVAGVAWIALTRGEAAPGDVATDALAFNPTPTLTRGAATMDSPTLHYSTGWTVTAEGADPAEPADPELAPSGTLTFTYAGRDLALRLATGDYRGHIYVSVDGAAANLLPRAHGHRPPAPASFSYLPLSAPERAGGSLDGVRWIPVHRAAEVGPHEVVVEVWRSWGQTPLRGVAVDLPLSTGPAIWPGVALLVAAIWCAGPAWTALARWVTRSLNRSPQAMKRAAQAVVGAKSAGLALPLGGAGAAIVTLSIALDAWWLCLAGLGILGLAGILRPAVWYAALFFALPFYFRFSLPLLPGRAVNLVDAGVWLGLAATLLHAALATAAGRTGRTRIAQTPLILLAALASWALIAAAAAEYLTLALREWRTVFLMAAALATGLALALRFAARPRADLTLLVAGWLAGATVLASAALFLYPQASVIVPAEGVARLRAFYGSPNNLALYLERTLAVTLAISLFATGSRLRVLAALLAAPQAVALLLTFSRGALFVALPAMVLSLGVVGWVMLRRDGRTTRVLWWLAAPIALAALALLPFAGTERLQNWTSLAQGTGFLRLNLWRSAWQMAWDHPLLGVGPDQFLYAYRSGYILPQAWMEPNLNHPHNWLLDWWTRLGIPGLVLGLAFWWSVARGLAQRLGQSSGYGALAAGALAATFTALAHGLLDVSYALPDLMAVWALFALLASIRRVDDQGTG